MFEYCLKLKTTIINILHTKIIAPHFLRFGKNSIIGVNSTFIGLKKISIGNNTKIGCHAVITAWEKINNVLYSPHIIIGNNCSIGEYVHITSINHIEIGSNVLMGRRVTISDNSHGRNLSKDEIQIPPNQRKIYSKGGVIIEDNVWIGDKATILAGVKIGYGAIIGANSVVTKDIPPYCVVGGNPARILRIIN